MRLISIGLTIITAGVLFGWICSANQPQIPPVTFAPPQSVVPPNYFGLHLHHVEKARWPQVPFGSLRLWGAYVSWSDLEPNPGDWHFSRLDDELKIAEKHQVDVILTLGNTPRWASARPDDGPEWRRGGPAEPRDIHEWETYVRKVATRYKHRIAAYEIWNEPNLKEYYSGSMEQMLALAKSAYTIIHEVDPEAKVVSPSATELRGVEWLEEYLQKGGGQYADVIGYHFYDMRHNPEAVAPLVMQVRKTMAQHGVAKPLWNTESGWFIQSAFAPNQPGKTTLSYETAMQYTLRTYVIQWALGVSRMYFYDWDSNTMSLGDNQGRMSKPSALGYSVAYEWLSGKQIIGCSVDSGTTWTCELRRGNTREWIMWNPERKLSVSVPPEWKPERVSWPDIWRRQTLSRPATRVIDVGPTPVLLER